MRRRIVRAIRELLGQRAAGATICPSEVARALEPVDWRQHMSEVRAVAQALADAGEVMILQRGREVDGRHARGPIRIQKAARSGDDRAASVPGLARIANRDRG